MRLPILCYHKVGPQSTEGRFLNVEPVRLQQHVRFFKRRFGSAKAVRDLAKTWPASGFVLTFDDAYVSATEAGVEVLRNESVTATFYAVPEWVGRVSGWDGDRARPLANWSRLIELRGFGFEVGTHTMTHPDLSKLGEAEQRMEWSRAHAAFVAQGWSPESACYPYGRTNAESERALAGVVSIAVALGRRMARPEDPRLKMPRLVMSFGDSLPLLLYKLYLREHLPGKRRPEK